MAKNLRILRILMMAAAVMLCLAGVAYAQQIVSFDAGPSGYTAPTAINEDGRIVGAFTNIGDRDKGVVRGFLRKKDGSYLLFNAGSRTTVFNGINSKGQIIGYYTITDSLNGGFLLQPDGKEIVLKVGPWIATPAGINGAGVIVGEYTDKPLAWQCCSRAFVRQPEGTTTTIQTPNYQNYYYSAGAVGINWLGQVVGWYWDTQSHGFLWKPDGTLTSFDPIGSNSTVPTAISASGRIVGYYLDANNLGHGFVRETDGAITSIDIGNSTRAYAMNAAGYIVGDYYDGNSLGHGFFMKPDGTTISIDVGNVLTHVSAINEAGYVVGSYRDDKGVTHGFLWKK